MPTQCPVTQALHGWYQAVTRQRPSCEDEGRERLLNREKECRDCRSHETEFCTDCSDRVCSEHSHRVDGEVFCTRCREWEKQ